MRIRDEYLHGSDLTGVVKKIEVTIGTGNNANKSVIKYIKADSEGGVVEVPIGDITGKAATASKLDNTSAIGGKTNPVYFTANGVPSACTYFLNATVPVGSANQVLYYSATNTLGTQSYATLTSNLDVFTVATSSAAGKKGLVPAPSANQLGAGNFFLRADGVWAVIENKSAALNGTATSLVTTGEKYNWNSAYNWYNTMTSGDTDGTINKWKEVEAFLANYGDSTTLAAELAKLVTLSTEQTITGVKTFSEVINGSITGNAGTADKLKNALTLGVLNSSGAVVGTDTVYDGSSALSFKVKAGSGITLSQSTKGEVVITNAAPDVDHNTDTKVKLTATDGTATDRYIPFPGTSISSGSAYELFYQSDFKYNPGTKLFSVPNIAVGEKITVTGTSVLGTVTSGVWNGTPIANDYLAHKSVTINGASVNLGESIIVTAVANGGNAGTVGGYSPSDFLLKTEHETFESIIATALTDLDNRKIEASQIPTSLPANGGNADTVDGYHASAFATAGHTHNSLNVIKSGTVIDTESVVWSKIESNTDPLKFKVYEVYNEGGPTLYGEVLNVTGVRDHWQAQLWMAGTNGGRLYYRNKDYHEDTWGNWGTVAWTSDIPTSLPANGGNADTATKLQTARTLWGQSFDGTGNVSGALTDVSSISATGKITTNDIIFGYRYNTNTNSAAFVFDKPGSYYTGIGSKDEADTIRLGACKGDGGWVDYAQKWYFHGDIHTSGSIGIGTTSPSSKLHVVGDIYTTDGFKKEGSSNDYVLLGGGGHKALTDFSMAHEHPYLPLSGGTLTGDLTLPNINITNTLSVLPSHYYHHLYDSDNSVYEHFGNTTDRNKITYGHFRFFDGNGSYKTLVIGGNGTFIWDGNTVLTTANYNTYSPTLTGKGASGTWDINISGNAATAGNADTVDGIEGASIFRQIRYFGGASSDDTWIKIQNKGQYKNGICLISVCQWGHGCSFIFSISNTIPAESTLAVISKDSASLASNFRLSYSPSESCFYFKIAINYAVFIFGSETENVMLGTGELVTSTPEDLTECYNISINVADTAKFVDWSGVTNRPTNVSAFTNDAGYLTAHAYSYGSIDIYDVNGAKKTSNNTVSASVNTETLRLQEGANIAITATNSGTSGGDSIKIAVTGITSNIDRNGYGQLALWYNGASNASAILQSVTYNEILTVKAGSGIDFNGHNDGIANNDFWTISAIPYNCAITLNNNSAKSLIKDSWSADALSVYLTSNGTSSGTSLAAGTYALWIEDRSSLSGTPNYYSGTFTCAGSAAAGRLDEIALHSSMATSADTNAPTRIFVATLISNTSGKHVLRFCSLDSSTTNHYLTVKVNRII